MVQDLVEPWVFFILNSKTFRCWKLFCLQISAMVRLEPVGGVLQAPAS
jgi:hypothetical protein